MCHHELCLIPYYIIISLHINQLSTFDKNNDFCHPKKVKKVGKVRESDFFLGLYIKKIYLTFRQIDFLCEKKFVSIIKSSTFAIG